MTSRPFPILLAGALAALGSHAHAVTATWNFSSLAPDFVQGGGAPTMAFYDGDTAAVTTFGMTNGASPLETAVPDLPDGPAAFLHHPPLPNGGVGGYTLDFAPGTFLGNGGGAFVNSYTVVIDLYLAGLDWTALFQTNNAHTNDADWYVSPDGSVGIGSLGYSAPAMNTGAWRRLAFVHDGDAGTVKYFLDGSEIFNGAAGGTDGRHSLYTSDNPGPDFVFQGEGDGSGNYTNEAWISSFMIADYAVTDDQIARLGGASANGIIIPEPSTGLMLLLSLAAAPLLTRRRTA